MIGGTNARQSATRRGQLVRISLLLFVVMLFAGCLGRSPSVETFVLGSSGAGASDAATSDLAVLVGPARLPAYLDRPQMVRLEAGGEIEIDEFSRWLGGFEENFLRAVSLSVAREIGSVKVSAHPSKAPFPFDVRVPLHVDEMVIVASDVLRVRIRWALVRAETPPRLFVMEEDFQIDGGSTAARVAAHDRALSELSRRIAQEIAR